MSKRKLETADEESATHEQPEKVKKQKTNTSQAKALSNITPKHTEVKVSAQVPPDQRNEKLARKLVKREKRALEKLRRDESGRKDGIKTREDDEGTELVEVRESKSSEKENTAASRNRHDSRKREKEGGQKLTGKHKSKTEKRRDKTASSNGHKNKENAAEPVTWKVSDPLGGQMLDVDPVFSVDEK